MAVFISDKKYSVIKKLSGHTDYGDDNASNVWDKFLLKDELGGSFVLLTDRGFVFYLHETIDGKEELRESGCYSKLKWEGELNENTWL